MGTDEEEQLQIQIERGHARRLGGVENYFCILQRQSIYKNFVVTVEFNRAIATRHDLLFHSLRSLLLQYPILASSIYNVNDYSDLSVPIVPHDYIKVINTLRLRDVLIDIPGHIAGLSKTEQLKELNTLEVKYGPELSSWKIGFLDDQTLVFITNHVLSDGISAKHFIQDLTNKFNEHLSLPKVEGNSYDEEFLINYSLDHKIIAKLPPSLDSIVSYKPPLTYFPEYFLNFVFIKFLCFKSVISTRSDTHVYRSIKISPETLNKLKLKLHSKSDSSQKVTLTPYISAAWLRSLNEVILFKKTRLGITDVVIPCNARQYLQPSQDADVHKYGANTSGSHKYFLPLKEFNWKNILYYNQYFKRIFDKKRYLYNMGILTLDAVANSTNLDKSISDAIVGIPRAGTVFSNIGVINEIEEGAFDVKDVYFSQNSGGTMFTFSINTVATRNGGLNIVITVCEGAVSESTFDSLVQFFEKTLLDFGNL